MEGQPRDSQNRSVLRGMRPPPTVGTRHTEFSSNIGAPTRTEENQTHNQTEYLGGLSL